MMDMTYFVDYKLYNGDSNAWAYKTDLKTDDKDAAIRKFGALINDYYGKAPYVFGLITMTDMYGNVIEGNQKFWDKTPTPEPEPSEE